MLRSSVLYFFIEWLSTTFRLQVIIGGHRTDGQTDRWYAMLMRPHREGRIHFLYDCFTVRKPTCYSCSRRQRKK